MKYEDEDGRKDKGKGSESWQWSLVVDYIQCSKVKESIESRLVPRFLVCIVKFVIHVNYTNVIEP